MTLLVCFLCNVSIARLKDYRIVSHVVTGALREPETSCTIRDKSRVMSEISSRCLNITSITITITLLQLLTIHANYILVDFYTIVSLVLSETTWVSEVVNTLVV